MAAYIEERKNMTSLSWESSNKGNSSTIGIAQLKIVLLTIYITEEPWPILNRQRLSYGDEYKGKFSYKAEQSSPNKTIVRNKYYFYTTAQFESRSNINKFYKSTTLVLFIHLTIWIQEVEK